jgi:hypothetical protein
MKGKEARTSEKNQMLYMIAAAVAYGLVALVMAANEKPVERPEAMIKAKAAMWRMNVR